MLNVYVFSNGQVATQVFNAVAAYTNSANSGFATVLYIAAVFSIVAAVAKFIATKDYRIALLWLLVYSVVTTLFLGIKVDVHITDVTNPMATTGNVDNVPWGLAMPASLISTISYDVSQSMSDVFHTPDEADYNKTGILFGSKLYHSVLQSTRSIDDATYLGLTNFVSRCIVPDILINHKYTFNDIKNSPDIFGFLSGTSKSGKSFQMSPLRGFVYQGTFQTCRAVLPKLRDAVSASSTTQFAAVARWLGFNPTAHQGQKPFNAEAAIGNTYQYLMGMSNNAKNILMQNVAMNAIRGGIGASLAQNNASAAMINFATTTAQQKQLVTDYAQGAQAAYMMPMIQTALFLILVAVFPVVIALSIIPTTFFQVLKNYVVGFLWLAMWPVCFCVINYILNSALATTMTAGASAHKGITLSNSNELLYQIEQFAGYASWLINVTPVLAGGVLFGMYRAFMSAAQVMMSGMQNSVAATSNSVAQGDIALANTSVGNHNWNNVNANKFDTNRTHMAGASTTQLSDGATRTVTPGGNTVFNAQSGMSQLPVGLNLGHMLSANYQRSHEHAEQKMVSDQQQYQTSVGNAASAIEQYGHSQAINKSEGHGASIGSTTSFDHAMSTMNRLAKEAAQTFGISERQALTDLTQFSQNASLGVNTDKSIPGKIFSWATGVGANANASTTHTKQADRTNDVSHGHSESQQQTRLQEFSSALRQAQTYAQNRHAEFASSDARQLGSQLSSSLTHAEHANQNYTQDKAESARYAELASTAEQQSVALNENLAQPFVEYVEARYAHNPEMGERVLSDANDPAMIKTRNEMAEAFLQQYEGAASSWADSQSISGVNNHIPSNNQATVYAQNKRDTDRIFEFGQHTSFDDNAAADVMSEASSHQNTATNTLQNKNNDIDQAITKKSAVQKAEIDKGTKIAEEGAWLSTVKRFAPDDIKQRDFEDKE